MSMNQYRTHAYPDARSRWPALSGIRVTAMLAVFFVGISTGYTADPENSASREDLENVITAQQRQLDLVQTELESQREIVQELVQQVQQLTAGNAQAPAPVAVQPAPVLFRAATPPGAPAVPATDQREDAPDWPGSFGLFGSKTRMAIGGFAQLDLIHDTDAIDTPCEFVTSAIPTDGGTRAGGSDGQTSFCVNASRLTFESRTPTGVGQLKTFLSMDLFGDSHSSSPDLRIRQVYGELGGALWGGDLLLGQAWSTFVDLEAWPDVLDYEGPDSTIGVRQPMIRWTRNFSSGFDIRLAVEQPGNGSVEGADVLTRWPDGVGVANWAIGGGGHLRISGILRDIRASANDEPADDALGWGLSGSGKLMLPGVGMNDNLMFEVSYGKGTGAYYNDGPPDAVFDPATLRLDLLPVFGYYVGYEHGWSNSLSSTILYSALEVDNLDSEPDDAFSKTTYFSLNLAWRPDSRQMYGIEFLRGEREDKDGAEGADNRIQFSSKFSF